MKIENNYTFSFQKTKNVPLTEHIKSDFKSFMLLHGMIDHFIVINFIVNTFWLPTDVENHLHLFGYVSCFDMRLKKKKKKKWKGVYVNVLFFF